VTKEYGVYYKRIPTSDGGYVMDHIAILYMMDPTCSTKPTSITSSAGSTSKASATACGV
jgi:cytochrome oxidase Cu insertion factor (SCO1/SenC/PrrC family)